MKKPQQKGGRKKTVEKGVKWDNTNDLIFYFQTIFVPTSKKSMRVSKWIYFIDHSVGSTGALLLAFAFCFSSFSLLLNFMGKNSHSREVSSAQLKKFRFAAKFFYRPNYYMKESSRSAPGFKVTFIGSTPPTISSLLNSLMVRLKIAVCCPWSFSSRNLWTGLTRILHYVLSLSFISLSILL